MSLDEVEAQYWEEESRKNYADHVAMMRRNMANAVHVGQRKLGASLHAVLDEEDRLWQTDEKKAWISQGKSAMWDVINIQRQRWRTMFHRLYDTLIEEQLLRDSESSSSSAVLETQ
jgi:hypothetical protein